MKKKSLITYVLISQFFFCGLLAVALNPTITSSSTSNTYDLKSSAVDFSNATVVSDGFNSIYWNDGDSGDPDIEIMYATYTTATGWSNATVISDGYGGSYWNDGDSYTPAIAIDSSNATNLNGWSNITILSDGYSDVYWNDGTSHN